MQPFDDGPDAEIRYTDLKGAIELTPTQLATMQGDSETRLPSNRTRVFEQPASWQKWTSKSENTQNVGTTGASQQPARTITQATFILQTTNASKNSASMAATQTDALIQSYIAENGRPNHSPEIEFLDGLKTAFEQFETALDKNTTDAARIQELTVLLDASNERVTELTLLLADKPSTFHPRWRNRWRAWNRNRCGNRRPLWHRRPRSH